MAGFTVKIGAETGEARRRLALFKRDVSGTAYSIKRTLGGIGIGIGLGAVVRGGWEAVKSYAAFEKQLAEISTMADFSKGELAALGEQVNNLSISTGLAAEDINKGIYQALSAGVPKDNVMDFLGSASKAAIAGVTDVETAVDGLTSVLNAYKMPASDATKVSDIMFETVRQGKTTFGELSATLGRVLPIAAAAKVPFEEVAAAIATMTKQGVKSDEAVTQLRAVLSGTLKPTAGLSRVLKKIQRDLGDTSFESLPLAKRLDLIAAATGNNTEKMAALFPEIRNLNGVLQLTGTNASGAAKDLETIANSAGAAEKAFGKMADTTATKISKATQEIEMFKRTWGEALIKGSGGILRGARGVANAIRVMIGKVPLGEDLQPIENQPQLNQNRNVLVKNTPPPGYINPIDQINNFNPAFTAAAGLDPSGAAMLGQIRDILNQRLPGGA